MVSTNVALVNYFCHNSALMEEKQTLYSFLIVLQGLLFALVDIFTKIALETVPVFIFVSIRMGITAILLFLVFRKTIIHDMKKVRFGLYFWPAFCLAVSIIMSNIAVHLTAATSFAFLRSLTAIIVPLIMTLFFGRKYTITDVIIQTSLVAGLYLLCARGGLSTFGIGEILAFSCATLAAVSLVFSSRALKAVNPYTMTFMQMSCGCILALISAFATGSFATNWTQSFFTPRVLLILIYNVIIGSFIAYSIQNKVLVKVSPKTVGILQCAYPVFTALVANVLLGETMNTYGIIGSVIIIACIIAQSLSHETKIKGRN